MKNKIAFIIPYFGKVPDYFDLWLKSAENNPDFDFYIYSDLDFKIENESNVKIYNVSFHDLVERIRGKLKMEIKLTNPYKLCDFKPAYGYIFEEEISKYDFWGFCDIDLIFGNLSHFINDELLNKFDKLFFHGHFCIFRNCKKMNTLFLEKYENVINYEYAFKTKFPCHFDENGTVAYAHKNDASIRFYMNWCFFDVSTYQYEFIINGTKCYVIWDEKELKCFDFDKKLICEVMYIHLQKRNMVRKDNKKSKKYVIYRNIFDDYNGKYIINNNEYSKKEREFYLSLKKRRRKEILSHIFQGAIKFRLYRMINSWKNNLFE